MTNPTATIRRAFDRFSGAMTRFTGSSVAFVGAVAIILIWAITGPLFAFSDTWQLVINTGTTVVTFLMVFLIQHAQNKDSLALHLKLNELLAATRGASNRLVNVEDLNEAELHTLRTFYEELSKRASERVGVLESHSIDEARAKHAKKHGAEPE